MNVFEINEDEIEQWIKKHPEFTEGKIRFSNPIEFLTVKQIRVGKKVYKNTKDFLQDYSAEKYQITYYQRKYKEIANSMDPYTHKFYDEKDKLIKIQNGDVITVIEKKNPYIDILFINELIDIRESYLDDLYKRFVNGEEINIFHAGASYSHSPLKIGSMSILNEINLSNLTMLVLKYYNNTNLLDRNLKRFIEASIFELLISDAKAPLNCFLRRFKQKLCNEISFEKQLTKLEDGIIEFKSRDCFVGDHKKIAEKLSETISKRPFIICIVGIEDNGILAPIKADRLKSDRVEKIRRALEIEVNKIIYALPIIRGDDGIIIFIAGEKSEYEKMI